MSSSNENVSVLVRFRPPNSKERAKADKSEPWKSLQRDDKGIQIDDKELRLYNIDTNHRFKKQIEKFRFDALMEHTTTQQEAFEKVARPICDALIQGYNGTIFVYGQSGSGKTHTMYGPEEKKDSADIAEMGIIPQSCAYLFSTLNNPAHPLCAGMESYIVMCEFTEIYNNSVRDLMDPKNEPVIRQRKVRGTKDEWRVVVENVQRRQVRDLGEVLAAIRKASSNRSVSATNLNATSSRSHMIMRIIVQITTKDGKRTGIGNFSDLAGSEKVKKTGATGQRMEEAKGILLSLSTLATVIDALVKGKRPPFKDSKLTFMLADSLGGNSKTALLIACSPSVFNRTETVDSLRFGRRCRKIQNKAKINVVKSVEQLQKENDKLRAEIDKLKKKSKKRGLFGSKKPKPKNDDSKEAEPAVDAAEVAELKSEVERFRQMNTSYLDRMEAEMVKNQQMSERIRAAEEAHAQQRLRLDEREETINALTQQNSDLSELKDKMVVQSQEMSATTQRLNAMNAELNAENERLQRQRNEALSSEEQHQAVLAENERLHARVKELEALLGIERSKNVSLSESMAAREEQHSVELRERDIAHAKELENVEDSVRELGFTVESQRAELEAVRKAMAAMKERHLSEVRNLQAQLASLGEWNEQLESERETASAMMMEREKERERQRLSLSAVAAERDIVAKQLKELSAQFQQAQSAKVEEKESEEKGDVESAKEEESESESGSDSDSMLDMAAQQEEMMRRIIADRKANEAMLRRLENENEHEGPMSMSEEEREMEMGYGEEDLVAVQGLANADSVKVTKDMASKPRWSAVQKKERKKVVQTADEYLDYVDPEDGMGLIIADDDFF